jgi:hypothetical protein
MCVTDDVSSAGTSLSSALSLLRDESALVELPVGAGACATLSAVELFPTTARSALLEQETAESVSQSAENVTAPR